jgi:hypothetical protein
VKTAGIALQLQAIQGSIFSATHAPAPTKTHKPAGQLSAAAVSLSHVYLAYFYSS